MTVEEAQRRYVADAILYVQTSWVVASVAWDAHALLLAIPLLPLLVMNVLLDLP